MKMRLLLLVAWWLLAAACGSGNGSPDPGNQTGTASPGQAGSAGGPMLEPQTNAAGAGAAGSRGADAGTTTAPALPFGPGADVFVWSTERFSLDAGQERYLCYASTLAEDLVVNGYNSNGDSFVHHLILSRTRAPEPEGFAECDVAFRNTWDPLFITGAGDTTLEFPTDAGHQLNRGTQLVVQLHLLNVSDTPVEGALTINMRRSAVASPRPVSSYIFGTAAVELPAHETTEVVGTCSPFQQVKLIAGFPHMHLLGSSLRFEVGTSEADLHEVFARDPFDFDSQHIDPLELTIAPGNVTRVRCTFDNTSDQTIAYGESTRNEMCYFVGFAVDQPAQSACLEVLPPHIFGN